MARIESDREDLLREAVGLVPRVELRFPNAVQFTAVFPGGSHSKPDANSEPRPAVPHSTSSARGDETSATKPPAHLAAAASLPAENTPAEPSIVVAGFNKQGGVSLYFGSGDPVLQFDSACRLRRAFVDGLLYRSQGKTLSQLTRQRTATETVLLRRDLNQTECSEFLTAADELVRQLHAAVASRAWTEYVEEPVGSAAINQLQEFLTRLLTSPMSLSSALKV